MLHRQRAPLRLSIILLLVVLVAALAPIIGEHLARAQPVLQAATTTYVEDFSNDSDPALPGFAASVFMHTPGPSGTWQISGNEISTSPPHALFLYTASHTVRLNLPNNAIITRASIKANTRYGFGQIVVRHTFGEEVIQLQQGIQSWQTLDTTTIPGFNPNDLIEIELSGGEVLFDDIAVEVILPKVDLTLTQQLSAGSPDPPAPGDDVIFEMDVRNNSQDDATGVVLTETLPTGLRFDPLRSSIGCNEAAGTVTCDLGTIAAGAQRRIQIGGRVGTEACASLRNDATVSANEGDTNPADNQTTLTVNTTRSFCADLRISMVSAPSPIVPGDIFTHTLFVDNNGPNAANDVRVTFSLLGDGAVQSATVRGGSLCQVDSQVVCDLGRLPIAGAGQRLIDLVMVPMAEGETVNNRAIVASSIFDPVPANNAATYGEQVTGHPYNFVFVGDTDFDPGPFPYDDLYYARLNNQGTVAFQSLQRGSQGEPASDYGVFSGNRHLAQPTQIGQSRTTADFGTLDINNAGQVVYEHYRGAPGSQTADRVGLFVSENGMTPTIVRDFVPAEPSFFPGYRPRITDDGMIVFVDWDTFPSSRNTLGRGANMVAWQQGVETVLVDTDDGQFDRLGPPVINNNGDVLFAARRADGTIGLFLVNTRTPLPTIQTLVNSYEPPSIFADEEPSYDLNDNGAFVYLQGERNALRLGSNFSGVNTARIDAFNNSYADIIGVALNNRDDIVVRARQTEGGSTGIYRGPDPVADKVLAPGDRLSGRPVEANGIEAIDLNDEGQIAFVVDFTLPGIREIAVRADPRDYDRDGIDSAIEDGAANNGDGNNDGILDRAQGNVSSFPTSSGSYVTLESPAGTRLVNVQAISAINAAPAPPGWNTPFGVLAFEVHDLDPGASATVTLYLAQPVGAYWKYDPAMGTGADHWYQFTFDGTTGAEILLDRIRLHFVDGRRGDHDLMANGVIIDPGAPVVQVGSVVYLPVVSQ